MAFIPANNLVVKAAINYTLFNDPIVNTLWFEKTDEAAWEFGTMEDLSVAIEDWLVANLMPILNQNLIAKSVYITRQASATDIFHERDFGGITGGVLGEGLPSNVACSVKFSSGVMGRSFRGRNFVGGLSDSDVDGTVMDAAFVTDLVAAYGLLPTTVTAMVAANHIVCSHYTNGAPRATAVTVPVVGYLVRKTKCNTMRTRVN